MGNENRQTGSEPVLQKQKKESVCVSMNVADHQKLKNYAAAAGKTVSGVIKDWVDMHCGEEKEK